MRRIPTSSGLVGAAVREWRPINVPDVRRISATSHEPETLSELIVPLFYKGRVIGVLDLEHIRPNFFNEEHERMLTTLGAQIAIAMRMRAFIIRSAPGGAVRKRHCHGSRVQLRLLPPAAPSHPHAEMAVRFLPARTIGGDLYDFIDYGPNRTAIVLGDVSGKAAPAALFAALVSASCVPLLIRRGRNPRKCWPNSMTLCRSASLSRSNVTMLFALWNDENQTLQVANSGAVQPVFCRAGESLPVRAEGFPLGMFPNVTYEELSVATQPGDAIVFISDGILDAENEKEEMYARNASPRCFAPAAASRRRHRRGHPRRCSPLPGQPRPLRRRNHHRAESAVKRQGTGIRDEKKRSVPGAVNRPRVN